MKNGYGEITQYLYRVGLWFMSNALPLIAIYLYTEFYLNANSSFKGICRTRYRTEGQSGDYMLPTLGRIIIIIINNNNNIYFINYNNKLLLLLVCAHFLNFKLYV